MTPNQPSLEFTVENEDSQKRLDVLLSEKSHLTRSAAASLIENGSVKVNGQAKPKKYKPSPGEIITAVLPEPRSGDIKPQDINIDIIYQDSNIAVINKPRGMVVHPANGHWEGTLANALMFCMDSLSGVNGKMRPGIVHRLDKDTSGLLIIAKNDAAHQNLSEQFKNRTCVKIYRALAWGRFKESQGTVTANLARSIKNRKRITVTPQGRNAVTTYEVLEQFKNCAYIQCGLMTGRTHQIRVHMAYIGHPLLGDPVYGTSLDKSGFNGQALHSYYLEITHPETKERMSFTAPLPEDMLNLLNKLRNTPSMQ